jgi:hypothetical protein
LLLCTAHHEQSYQTAVDAFVQMTGAPPELVLEPLGRADTEALIRERLGRGEVDGALVDGVLALSSGNPFIAGEVPSPRGW